MMKRSPVDQHREAMDAADKYQLPQTVFYHPDFGFANTAPYSKILKDRKTELYVTWLPDRFFA